MTTYKLSDWLPTTRKEMEYLGWEQADVILFTGDAYVDHPAFGAAVIGRVLQSLGLKVAIVPQPNWQDDLRDFKKMGAPRLFFGVTAGNMDSMVNHYTANRRLRSDDAYTAGGKSGFRPDYAVTVYSKALKKLWPDVPIVIGGIEASLRRVTHYDYWEDKLKASVLYESGADILVYGLGEKPIVEVTKLAMQGIPMSNIRNVRQTAYIANVDDKLPMPEMPTKAMASHEECLVDKVTYARNFRIIEEESNKWDAYRLTQEVGGKLLVINPPFPPLNEDEVDWVYDLPYTRLPHPKYEKKGAIPAFDMIKWSVNTHRGCFGGCSFCTISAHQGKFVSSRSEASILREVEKIAKQPDFKGHITDMGGPSANMYKMKGIDLSICERCRRPSCIFPTICDNLDTSHQPMNELFEKASKIKNVKRLTVGSGIRYDMLYDQNGEISGDKKVYMEKLVQKYVSGRLKVAPEHTERDVLRVMRKPSFSLFHKFKQTFDELNEKNGTRQQLIPYFISSHPGSSKQHMARLAAETKMLNFQLEQVQDFTPTPMTLATEMYYTGINPYTLEPIEIAKTRDDKLAQRKYFFWYKPEERAAIKKDLMEMDDINLVKILLETSNKPRTKENNSPESKNKAPQTNKPQEKKKWNRRR